jgi:hypothetical protein
VQNDVGLGKCTEHMGSTFKSERDDEWMDPLLTGASRIHDAAMQCDGDALETQSREQ